MKYGSMKNIKPLVRQIWNDPVWSNLIANGVTAFVAWLFIRLTSASNSNSVHADLNSDLQRPVPLPENFSILPETVTILFYIFLGCLTILVLVFLWRMRTRQQ
jgi:hypothetical protein